MRERWRKDEKGKWENHRLNTGIMIDTYRYIQYVSDMYIYIYIVFLFFFVFQSGAVFLAIWLHGRTCKMNTGRFYKRSDA